MSASRLTDKLAWKVTFRRPDKHPFWHDMPLTADTSYVYEVVLGNDQYGQPLALDEKLRTDEPFGDHKEPLKLLEATPLRSRIFSPVQHRLVPFDQAINQEGPLFSEETNVDSPDQLATQPSQVSQQERSLRLAQMRFFNEYPIPSWTRALFASLGFYTGFDVERYSDLRTKPADIRPETTLLNGGQNLGTVLHEMLTRAAYRTAADDLREFLRVAYPSFEDIFAETSYGTPPKVLARIREKGMRRSMELWDLSDGTLRFLCLAAALLNPSPPPFIAIDEPEVGLHPRLLPIVADMIKTAAETVQVMVTTHSPDLLNCFDIEEVAVIRREDKQIMWRRPGSRSSLKKMLENVVGETLGDLHRSGELEALE